MPRGYASILIVELVYDPLPILLALAYVVKIGVMGIAVRLSAVDKAEDENLSNATFGEVETGAIKFVYVCTRFNLTNKCCVP